MRCKWPLSWAAAAAAPAPPSTPMAAAFKLYDAYAALHKEKSGCQLARLSDILPDCSAH